MTKYILKFFFFLLVSSNSFYTQVRSHKFFLDHIWIQCINRPNYKCLTKNRIPLVRFKSHHKYVQIIWWIYADRPNYKYLTPIPTKLEEGITQFPIWPRILSQFPEEKSWTINLKQRECEILRKHIFSRGYFFFL